MKVSSLNVGQIRFISQKQNATSKAYSTSNLQQMHKMKLITTKMELRNDGIDWMHRVYKCVNFSLSTFYFCIGLLDKLIIKQFDLCEENVDLVSAAIILIGTKFNQIYPITIKKLNLLAKGRSYNKEDYSILESQILEFLGYEIVLEQNIYSDLAQIVLKQQQQDLIAFEELVRLVLLNPQKVFKYGANVLCLALQKGNKETLRINQNNSSLSMNVAEVKLILHSLQTQGKKGVRLFKSPVKYM